MNVLISNVRIYRSSYLSVTGVLTLTAPRPLGILGEGYGDEAGLNQLLQSLPREDNIIENLGGTIIIRAKAKFQKPVALLSLAPAFSRETPVTAEFIGEDNRGPFCDWWEEGCLRFGGVILNFYPSNIATILGNFLPRLIPRLCRIAELKADLVDPRGDYTVLLRAASISNLASVLADPQCDYFLDILELDTVRITVWVCARLGSFRDWNYSELAGKNTQPRTLKTIWWHIHVSGKEVPVEWHWNM
ncbi:uncharacterized protein BJ212DRAFT_1294855 [Suillus subaureus]|uniref:Uncharacterized protein n=1 Tax=Suillus subaureus TaxID=48587 RepID=A0A9P7EQY2_9AGAM|nr:uncharacterized protein BJ212DRAFT_1294855 [Suillus subaureus]KAG1827635.1 hypothetical protein BJ212DRAFT_1294855 [Suillus subaureus]